MCVSSVKWSFMRHVPDYISIRQKCDAMKLLVPIASQTLTSVSRCYLPHQLGLRRKEKLATYLIDIIYCILVLVALPGVVVVWLESV